jgi:hypothetical protein
VSCLRKFYRMWILLLVNTVFPKISWSLFILQLKSSTFYSVTWLCILQSISVSPLKSEHSLVCSLNYVDIVKKKHWFTGLYFPSENVHSKRISNGYDNKHLYQEYFFLWIYCQNTILDWCLSCLRQLTDHLPLWYLRFAKSFLLNIHAFWDVTLCHWVNGSWNFKGMWCLYRHGFCNN